MTKTKFLTLLQEQICMLDDAEQKDILDEYAQHIDMKVENGMTEAEAIEDFGPLDELAAEILGAYHVKPMAASSSDSVAADIDDLKASGHHLAAATVSLGKKGCSGVGKALRGAALKLRDAASVVWAKIKEAFRELADWHPFKGKNAEGALPARRSGFLLSDLKNGSISFGKFCWRSCLTLVRWCWNFCVACMVAASFITALCSIFGVGLCVILVTQGYPFGGVTVGLLGATLFFGSLGFVMSKIIRRKNVEGGLA